MSSSKSHEVRQLTVADINEGDSYTFEVDLTEGMIDSFSRLTGDVSTLHLDADFAKKRGFESRVCHGVLLGGLFSRLVGVHLPGQNALLQTMNLKFLQPAYAGMTLVVHGVVCQVSESNSIIVLKADITDMKSETVLVRAKIQVGLTG